MPEPTRSGGHTSAAPSRDSQRFLMVAAVCVALIGGLALVSLGAPSSAQRDRVALRTPVITLDEGCTNFARFWTVESGVHVPLEAIEGLSNCRLSEAGSWFVPDGVNDPRLTARSGLTAGEEAMVASLRALLIEDLNALEDQLPGFLKESLEVNYADENLPVFGHTVRGRTDFTVKRNRYQRITQAFLLSPERIELAEYVGWVMERRSLAIAQFETACSADPDLRFLLRACFGMRGEFNVAAIPILWDLTDPVLLREYLVARARSGEPLPGASSTPTVN